MANYTATYDRSALVRGDTLLPLSVTITVDEIPADIMSVRSQLRNPGGILVHTFALDLNGNTVTYQAVGPEVTAHWPVLVLHYDLEVTLASGRVVTWLKGSLPIVKDRTFS